MWKKYKYDLIFSIGAACSCTEALRENALQYESYPFDWLFGSSCLDRMDILISRFERWINYEDLIKLDYTNGDKKNPCDVYKNTYNSIVFNHDFPENIPLSESYNQVKQKYDRRINRLINNIKQSNRILLVYIETPNAEEKLANYIELEKKLSELNSVYSDKTFDLLYCTNDMTFNPMEYNTDIISSNITIITGNYKSLEKEALPYEVNKLFFKRLFKPYKLNISLYTNIKYKIIKIIKYIKRKISVLGNKK